MTVGGMIPLADPHSQCMGRLDLSSSAQAQCPGPNQKEKAEPPALGKESVPASGGSNRPSCLSM